MHMFIHLMYDTRTAVANGGKIVLELARNDYFQVGGRVSRVGTKFPRKYPEI